MAASYVAYAQKNTPKRAPNVPDNRNRKNTFVPGLHLLFAPLRLFDEPPLPRRFPLEDCDRVEGLLLRDCPREGVDSFDRDRLLDGVDSELERSRTGLAP